MFFISENRLLVLGILSFVIITLTFHQMRADGQDYTRNDNALLDSLNAESEFKRTDNRRYFHSKEELALTKVVKINPGKCIKDTPIAIFIHSVAQSTGHYYEKTSSS